MKKILSILLILSLFVVQNTNILPVFANGLKITSVRIGELTNNTAQLSWHTNEKTKATIRYGLDTNDLKYTGVYHQYDNYHELKLRNLEKNKTYYYKIIAKNQSGDSVETFVQSFSTKEMTDTIAPRFVSTKVYQTTSDAVALGWTTDERAKGTVYYGTDFEDLDKKKGFNYGTERNMYIYGLRPNTKYYFRVIIKDSSGNERQNTFITNTNNILNENTDLQIRNIKPTNHDSELVFANRVHLSWDTNFISKGMISYGTKANKLSKKAYSNDEDLSFDHQIILEDLEPNTTYYYKIKVYDALYNKTITTNVKSFVTVPEQHQNQDEIEAPDEEVLGEKIVADDLLGSIVLDKNHRYSCHDFDNRPMAEEFYRTYGPLGYDVYKMNTNGNSAICENIKFANKYLQKNTSVEPSNNSDSQYVTITAPQVLGIKITSPFTSGTDSDKDGLPDTFEAQIATDPFNPDTDGDGYDDGTEIANNYNPHGPGKIYETIYDKPRMNDDIVADKANVLKYYLGQADVDLNDIGSLEWVYLLNAYVYGEYPEEAIIQAVKYEGRTVHPTVPWKFWRNSEDYNYFINRE